MLNRKGHVPTWLLLVEGLVLMLVVWFTLLQAGADLGDKAYSIAAVTVNSSYERAYIESISDALVKRAVERADKQNFESSFASHFEEEAQKIDVLRTTNGNFFAEIRNHHYEVISRGSGYTLVIKNISSVFMNEQNKISSTFDISVNFDQQGLQAQ